MTRRRVSPRTRPFRELFDGLRRQLDAAPASSVLAAARERQPMLRDASSVEELLARMADEHVHEWIEREALTRAFIAEHQRDAGNGFWSALLLLAYFPMLSHLRFRLRSETLDSQDLDSVVITSFLEVVTGLDLEVVQDRTAMQLRQRTQRKVFHVLGRTSAEHRHIALATDFSTDLVVQAPSEPLHLSEVVDSEQTVAQLLDVAGQQLPPEQLEILVATVLQKERLRTYAGRYTAKGETAERVYQRLKRRRTRAMDRLRSLISRSRQVAGSGDTAKSM